MAIVFEARSVLIGSTLVVLLPPEASEQLPSRGMCMAEGTLGEVRVVVPLEPDGRGGHWFDLGEALGSDLRAWSGLVSLEVTEAWPVPSFPPEFEDALREDSGAFETWRDTTSKARWDWLRWYRSTNNVQTKHGRLVKAMSMLGQGKRRPCCFDRARCTVPELASSGKLKEPNG